jgi:hypothetical protein
VARATTSRSTSVGQDGPAFGLVGEGDLHRPVEPSGAQQGRVEALGAVGGRHDHDAGGGVEAVHLGQQLVQGVFSFVVAAQQGRAAAAADGVQLVDENDGRSLFAGLLEEVAHPGGAHADEHLDKRRAREGQERGPGLPGHGPGHQRLARARRAHHQHASRPDGPGPAVLIGVLQEIDHLCHFLFDPGVTGHVFEPGGRTVVDVVNAGLGTAEAGDAADRAASATADPGEQGEEHHQREEVRGHAQSGDALGRAGYLDLMAQQLAGQLGVGQGGGHLGGVGLAVGQPAADLAVGADAGRLYLVMGDLGDEIGEAEGPGRGGRRRAQERREGEQQTGDHQPGPPWGRAAQGGR